MSLLAPGISLIISSAACSIASVFVNCLVASIFLTLFVLIIPSAISSTLDLIAARATSSSEPAPALTPADTKLFAEPLAATEPPPVAIAPIRLIGSETVSSNKSVAKLPVS